MVMLADPHEVCVNDPVLPSLQVAVQLPDTGQLQLDDHETDDGEKLQLTPFRLFTTCNPPPLMTRLDRSVPEIVILDEVVVVKSKSVAPPPN